MKKLITKIKNIIKWATGILVAIILMAMVASNSTNQPSKEAEPKTTTTEEVAKTPAPEMVVLESPRHIEVVNLINGVWGDLGSNQAKYKAEMNYNRKWMNFYIKELGRNSSDALRFKDAFNHSMSKVHKVHDEYFACFNAQAKTMNIEFYDY